MWDAAAYLSITIFLAAGILVLGFFARSYVSSTRAGAISALFKARAERRLDILEQVNLDARRKFILIRRDDVEHLIITGGPVDVVIETGISASRPMLASGPVGQAVSKNNGADATVGSAR